MIYEYVNKSTVPDGDQIWIDLLAGVMSDKNIEGISWHEKTNVITVTMTNSLNSGDEAILDTIVNNNS